MRMNLSLAVAALAAAAVVGCDEQPAAPDAAPSPTASAAYGPGAAGSSSMIRASAPFKNFHQGFEIDARPWAAFTAQGGWCGSITLMNRGDGDVLPSAGAGYAVVEHGRCAAPFPPVTSAPSSGPFPDLLSTSWPTSGFVHQIDVYLEPSYPGGTDGPDYDDPENGTTDGLVYQPDGNVVPAVEDIVFTFAASFCVLDDQGVCAIPQGLRYVSVPVTRSGGDLEVAGRSVEEAGWYTFRYIFDSDGQGRLAVDFQLARKGRVLVAESVTETMSPTPFAPVKDVSSFDVSELGSGYLWFASIADGLGLPVDEHILRPGH